MLNYAAPWNQSNLAFAVCVGGGGGGWAQLTLHVFLRALSTLVFETAHSLNVDLTTSVRLTGPQAPGLPVCLGSERWDYGGEL